ncbi:hypothetical protein [Vibrio vulnificus]|uniref:hypothetical protein n=1 Tax=Vibrio vulnificus TaxID=672 RepID=UPI001CDD5E7C|nr:hypothetical protein [Vibrio vulnificus]MCA3928878.1 hypothetical protein [Vibrio vulnificus]
MNWKVIHALFEGFLGKSLLILALATPMSFLAKANVNVTLFVISLIGAIFVVIGYIWSAVSTPALIKDYVNGYTYSEKLVSNDSHLDIISEFKILEDNASELKEQYDGYYCQHKKFSDIDSFVEEVGKNGALRSLAILKYDYINKVKENQRYGLTVLFFTGAALVYFPLFYRIFVLLGGS